MDVSRSKLAPLAAALLVIGVVSFVARSAPADDAVYIWRDANGTVRFSPAPAPRPSRDDEATVPRGDDTHADRGAEATRKPY